MSRTCPAVTEGKDGDTTVCGKPAVVELTIGPRPFTYVDLCKGCSSLEVECCGHMEVVDTHPIPEALR